MALAVQRWKKAVHISMKEERIDIQAHLLRLQAQLLVQKAFYNWVVCCLKYRRNVPRPHVATRAIKEIPKAWR